MLLEVEKPIRANRYGDSVKWVSGLISSQLYRLGTSDSKGNVFYLDTPAIPENMISRNSREGYRLTIWKHGFELYGFKWQIAPFTLSDMQRWANGWAGKGKKYNLGHAFEFLFTGNLPNSRPEKDMPDYVDPLTGIGYQYKYNKATL